MSKMILCSLYSLFKTVMYIHYSRTVHIAKISKVKHLVISITLKNHFIAIVFYFPVLYYPKHFPPSVPSFLWVI